MPDLHYTLPQLTEIYDYDSGWSDDRSFYLSLADRPEMDVLDLGCGTGLLCRAYAENGHRATGVDPAAAMLAVGRGKPYGDRVNWDCAPAQSWRGDKTYDLVIMTGHAFQVMLEDADIAATLATMRAHLKPDGRAVFESRNPAIDWGAKWAYRMKVDVAGTQVEEERRLISMENGRMVFDLYYRLPEGEHVSRSELRFATRAQIEAMMAAAGLRIEKLLGDWRGGAFDPEKSEEMIFIARPA